MTHDTRAAILAEACRWQAEMPGRRNFKAESRSWGLSLTMSISFYAGPEQAEVCFWESTPDDQLTPGAIRDRIAGAWGEVFSGARP